MLQLAGNLRERICFIGGPFDGHSQLRGRPFGRLPINLVWLVCSDAFEQLGSAITSENIADNHASLTSVALYRLDLSGESEVYRYSGAVSASKFGEMLSDQDFGNEC